MALSSSLDSRLLYYINTALLILLIFSLFFIYFLWLRLKRTSYLSFHDQLTGLYNRNFFEAELKRLDNSRNLPLTLVICDLNSLKYINDTYGHKAGDQALVKIGEVLKQSCRDDDVLARWGGDEFILLLPETGDRVAKEVFKRIKNNIDKAECKSFDLTVSLGFATKRKIGEDIEDVFEKADNNLYDEKKYFKKSLSLDSSGVLI